MSNEVKNTITDSLDKNIYLDYINSCINNENKNISEASLYVMRMLTEILNDPERYSPEDLSEKQEELFSKLTKEEKAIMNKFLLSCIYSREAYNGQSKKEKNLIRKKGNDLNVKS